MPPCRRSRRRTCATSSCNRVRSRRRPRARSSASCSPTSMPAGAGWCARRTSRENEMMHRLVLLMMLVAATISSAAAETLKVAVAQRGFWNSSFVDVALQQGYFKQAGLDIEILYTEGGASTLTPLIAGSIDVAMTNGTLGVIAAYAKGMPVRIISAEATGAPDAFWYARPESGIKTLP